MFETKDKKILKTRFRPQTNIFKRQKWQSRCSETRKRLKRSVFLED